MPSTDPFDYMAAEPFRPFRILFKNGQVHDIRYPSRIAIGRDTVWIYIAGRESPGVSDHWEKIPLSNIDAISHLDIAVI